MSDCFNPTSMMAAAPGWRAVTILRDQITIRTLIGWGLGSRPVRRRWRDQHQHHRALPLR